MAMERRLILALLLLMAGALPLAAADVWIVRGMARLPGCPAPRQLVWNADAILFNPGDRETVVRVVEVSNDGFAGTGEMLLPPGKALGVQRSFGDVSLNAPLWVTHLDVDAGILIDGRLEYLYNDCTLRPQPTDALGKWKMPVFRELIPAGRSTVYPGVDLGAQDTRLNVGIYNDGLVAATATVQVFRTGCPEQPPVSQVTVVPSKTLIQTSIFQLPPQCFGSLTVPAWVAHAVVTVDQPSLSYAVALSNASQPQVTVGFSN